LVLLPVVGPVDASMMLETALPATEEVIDRFGIAARRARAEKQESAPQPAQVKEKEAAGKGQQGTGAVTGGLLGGLLGAAAAFLVPGIGPVIAGGVLVGLLSGAAMGGVAGGFLGAFVEMGVPEEQARYFEREFRAGRAILTVKIENRRQELLVRNIVQRHGAEHIEAH
ncbi:MAG: hypothetical protein J2P37_36005, partial [Ktedonobacteraceae bacterium]|nr:hypothetical protein [Ktedonobacteraceae bacterium]